MESELVEKLAGAIADAESALVSGPEIVRAFELLYRGAKEALTLARSLPAWPPMRETGTAPKIRPVLVALRSGDKTTGIRLANDDWSLAGYERLVGAHHVLGWWPLPEVPR